VSAEDLLSRLHKVKRTGPDRWMACCPAHEDKRPSLSIRELDGGLVLVHCFGLCSVESVLDAVGLTFDALYPEKPLEHGKPLRKPFPAADVLQALTTESLIVALVAKDIASGKSISEQDRERVMLATARIQAGQEIANGVL
jgi:hypothetical protein